MKVAPIIRDMNRYPLEFEQVLVHTGQHYDDNMSRVFFDDLGLPSPDVYLGIGSGTHAQQTARVMEAFESAVLDQRPDWVVVVGDVNSTLGCALTAAKMGTKVAHVEAGLRSFDRTMPEEYNRLLTDHISDLLFTHSQDANENLVNEGIQRDRIQFVGNIMIDTLVELLPKALERWRSSALDYLDVDAESPYVLVTLHRPSNVDEPGTLSQILAALTEVAYELPVIFPVHPRTRRRLEEGGLEETASDGRQLRFVEPLGYLDFLALEARAALVLTDSGGVQEETTFLGVPCLTLRPNTERPVTITHGTNHLVSADRDALVRAVRTKLKRGKESPNSSPPELWDGRTAGRIVNVFRQHTVGRGVVSASIHSVDGSV
jgi:UDP-N-acetylglucosamine 2-epimerase (non-hydrolysing)